MVQEMLPAPVAEATEGEVIDTQAVREKFLKDGEAVVRKNLVKYETSRTIVVRALYLIKVTGVWKTIPSPANPKKAAYTNFKTYVRERFAGDFNQTPERLYQLFKDIEGTEEVRAELETLVERGVIKELPAVGTRTREATKISVERSARTTAKQMAERWEAFANRIQNTEEEEGYDTLVAIQTRYHESIGSLIEELNSLAESLGAESDDTEGTEEE